MAKIKVYIASAYTIGDTAKNVKAQIDVTNELYRLGFNVFAPIVGTHFQHMVYPKPYDFWLDLDYEWIAVCDCLLRLPGESKGADKEVRHAERIGKKVFNNIVDIEYYYMDRK